MLALCAAACPDCPPARAARALVFSHGFWTTAWYVLLPFAVVLLAARWIVRRVDREAHDDRS